MPQNARLPVWNEKSVEQKLDALHSLILDLYGYVFSSSLEKLLGELHAYQSASEIEKTHIAAIIEAIKKHPNAFSRNCESAHLIGSALVIDVETGKILLHFHKRLGKWLQFGGHADYETDFAQVALRQAREESGLTDLEFFPDAAKPRLIDVDVHTIPQTSEVPQHEHLDLRYLLATRQAKRLLDGSSTSTQKPGESSRFEWLSFAEAKQKPILEDLIRLIGKAEKVYLDFVDAQKQSNAQEKQSTTDKISDVSQSPVSDSKVE